jgi:hypothetical protein
MAQAASILPGIRDVVPSALGWEKCLQLGDPCNWAIHGCVCAFTEPAVMSVADQSPNRHATKHFHPTNHPIIEVNDPPEGWSCCCVDEIMFDLSDRPTPQGSRDFIDATPRCRWGREGVGNACLSETN